MDDDWDDDDDDWEFEDSSYPDPYGPPVYEEEYRGYTIKVYPDPDPDNPRQNQYASPMSTILTFMRFESWSDEKKPLITQAEAEKLSGWSELQRLVQRRYGPLVVIEPLMLYRHSGDHFALGADAFVGQLPQGHYRFDVGQAGFMFVTAKSARQHLGVKRITAKLVPQIAEMMLGEFRTFKQWVDGEIYGYTITGPDGEEVNESWGYWYTHNSDDWEEWLQGLRGQVDRRIAYEEGIANGTIPLPGQLPLPLEV